MLHTFFFANPHYAQPSVKGSVFLYLLCLLRCQLYAHNSCSNWYHLTVLAHSNRLSQCIVYHLEHIGGSSSMVQICQTSLCLFYHLPSPHHSYKIWYAINSDSLVYITYVSCIVFVLHKSLVISTTCTESHYKGNACSPTRNWLNEGSLRPHDNLWTAANCSSYKRKVY